MRQPSWGVSINHPEEEITMKKLHLNKETLISLSRDLTQVQAGRPDPPDTFHQDCGTGCGCATGYTCGFVCDPSVIDCATLFNACDSIAYCNM